MLSWRNASHSSSNKVGKDAVIVALRAISIPQIGNFSLPLNVMLNVKEDVFSHRAIERSAEHGKM